MAAMSCSVAVRAESSAVSRTNRESTDERAPIHPYTRPCEESVAGWITGWVGGRSVVRVRHASTLILACQCCPSGIRCERSADMTILVRPLAWNSEGSRVSVRAARSGRLRARDTTNSAAISGSIWTSAEHIFTTCSCTISCGSRISRSLMARRMARSGPVRMAMDVTLASGGRPLPPEEACGEQAEAGGDPMPVLDGFHDSHPCSTN